MSDSEHTSLMPETQGTGAGQGGTSRKKPPPPDWGKYGLSQEPAKVPYSANVDTGGYQHTDLGNKNELFQEDQVIDVAAGRILRILHACLLKTGFPLPKGQWGVMNISTLSRVFGKHLSFTGRHVTEINTEDVVKAHFFISEPVLFGTWDGVFTSCMINLLGVVIFLRMGWIVGNAGISLTILTIILAVLVVLIVALSGIGVCERCKVESGGVYFLISHVLGSRIGGSVGVVYCFAQAVTCSLSVMGFGESIMGLTGIDNPWIAKGVAIALVILLLGINIAGVKWVIRLQLVLLFILFLSVMDFFVGSFVHTDYEHGVTGYQEFNLHNNSGPAYLPGETFFSIFGLFFSTVTGILAGINMSGDLREPFVNIPRGTLSALGVSTFLYISFTLVIGATCSRSYLQKDYMIAEQISVVGVLWLAGLYISSVSACMGSLYGPPRILQTIANENVIPIIRVLGHGRGPNKVPIYSLVLITLVVLLFVLVGDVNTLAPIVTTAFMMSYAAVNYAYFALAMSYDRRQARDLRFGVQDKSRSKSADISSY
ncbi:LOW QUALITY PROTEIN: solute carrier family 12 member 8-like, partial [Mercenaria mercenaria]|uniref:LOW QUALITY PROTEIN: solute carrier family 12 member 8-like n=1 Tax=Mercenaria mercenaria TaxID=6596 RepID=UPI00234EF654